MGLGTHQSYGMTLSLFAFMLLFVDMLIFYGFVIEKDDGKNDGFWLSRNSYKPTTKRWRYTEY